MKLTILITRPEDASLRFADQLRERFGCDLPILISPVMRIEYCEKLPDLTGFTHLIFTSRNGVAAFCALSNRRDVPCYTVGGATAEAAQVAGLHAVSAGGTADDLVERIVRDGVSGPLLHIRGDHAVGAVATRLTDAGMQAQDAILYRQQPEVLTQEAIQHLRGKAPLIAPIFSPRSARLLFSAIHSTAPLTVVALSENVAKALPDYLKNNVFVAPSPDATAMLDVIGALIADGKSLEGIKRAQ